MVLDRLSTIYPVTGDVEERKNEIFCIAIKERKYIGKLKNLSNIVKSKLQNCSFF